jgi:hypothetical protein
MGGFQDHPGSRPFVKGHERGSPARPRGHRPVHRDCFDTAFNAVALLFVFAAPVLVAVNIGLHVNTRAAR